MASSHEPPPQTSSSASTPASTSAASATRPTLAVKAVAPAPAVAVRPLQRAGSGSVGTASITPSVVSLAPATPGTASGPQSPASALSPAGSSSCGMPGKPPMSITSREWVIPPRPKPGRKPATDTPPTKRKAQNRAAQRAFRERRAARVGELEEQLDEQKAEHDRVEQEYCEKIRALEMDLQVLHSRCQILESLLEKEKTANQAWAASQAATNQQTQQHNQQQQSQQQHSSGTSRHQSSGASSPGHDASLAQPKTLRPDQLPRGSASSSVSSASGRWSSAQAFSISQIISPPDEDEDLTCGSCDPNGPCLCAEDALAVTAAMDCTKCSTLGSKCVCLEDSMRAINGSGSDAVLGQQDRKRAHSSTPPPLRRRSTDEKKPRFDTTTGGTEIDFTNLFSSSSRARSSAAPTTINPISIPNSNSTRTRLPAIPPRQSSPAPRFEIPMKDKCGFCSDGTYCVCADSMPGVTMTGSLALSAGTVVAQQKTPPPSENDGTGYGSSYNFGGGGAMLMPLEVTPTGAITLSSLRRQREAAAAAASPASLETAAGSALPSIRESLCGPGGPGTCAQCLADPVSGLFCRSLAANFARQAGGGERVKSEGGCCGGGGAGGGCCKDKAGGGNSSSTPSTLEPKVQQSQSQKQPGASSGAQPGAPLRLSCADAYKTLASHRHFDEATDDIGTWLPKLRAAPRYDDRDQPARSTAAPDRVRHHPLEVEAASIMSVLKGFDVRFGKSA